MRIYTLVLGGIGLFFLLESGLSLGRRFLPQWKGARAPGKIVDYVRYPTRAGAAGHAAVVEFLSPDGQTRRIETSTRWKEPWPEKGTKLDVVYHRDRPSTADIAGLFTKAKGVLQ